MQFSPPKNNNQKITRHGAEISIKDNLEKQNPKIINYGAADNWKLDLQTTHKKEIVDGINFIFSIILYII